ncbi:DUF4097 family beta strand repeat-containing protein [Saccharothrix syringae]|uniref:Adhesin domain-containing protein n=1 Tax=Saccharothrix syringae TaxID=103733 RepID=A0A5Q0GSD8_SACSY|nr:DUF4097 family beta strand repeat-containing protein [Saccharothrix syringae]QFZ16575.1 hypothetical protein EKG83_03015 [Saccharothrix syringae]
MPVFDTPRPITLDLTVHVGGARITAAERADTEVEVRPTDAANDKDVRAAEATTVDFTDGRLVVRTPRTPVLFGRPGSVDVAVALPAGSSVVARGSLADFRGDGPLGECRVTTSAGHIELHRTGALRAQTSIGDVVVAHTTGRTEVTTGTGEVRIGRLDGSGAVKNSNGATHIGEVTGDVRVNAANGGIRVGTALGDVHARTSTGHIRLGDVVRGSVVLESRAGELEVGIREGTAAWLDVRSQAGRVHNRLTATDLPAEGDERVEVRGRTSLGDIVIRRA